MTTVINNPSGGESTSDSAFGIIIGSVIAVILIVLFLVYGLPYLRSNSNTVNTQQPDSTYVNVVIPPTPTPTPTPTP